MVNTLEILIIAFAYVCILFTIAYYSDKYKEYGLSSSKKAIVYSFSLAVYCTSWTFYGAVGSAASTGWGYLPIYLGPILMYTFGWSFMRRFVTIAHQQNATSISDFIAARYDKSQTIAKIVTLIAVLAIIPYIALQMKAITIGIQAFDIDAPMLSDQYRNAFYIALTLIVFSILFGTRNIEVTEHQYGMMNAIAFESIIKLVAFLTVGFFALFSLYDGPADLYQTIVGTPKLKELFLSGFDVENFVTQTLLAAAAIFCLPRQFHVSVVEYHQEKDIKYARVIFPIYLILFSIFIIPIVVAGTQQFANTNANADFYVLLLPITLDQSWISIVSFIGGLSAATAMVIVATVTLSTMVSNDFILPNLYRFLKAGLPEGTELNKWILLVRRLSIVFLLSCSYIFYLAIDTRQSLASFGLISFSAVIQFAPALIIGMYWLKANRKGAITGLILGTSVWLYLIWPAINGVSLLSKGEILTQYSILTEAVVLSVLVNAASIIIVSLKTPQSFTEKIQSFAFALVKSENELKVEQSTPKYEIRVKDLKSMASVILGQAKTNTVFSEYRPKILDDNQIADQNIIEFTESMLASVIGAPSAHEFILTAFREKGMDVKNVFSLLNTTSRALKFNRDLLDITMDNISQGISVIDADKRLVGWNESYERLMNYPEGMLKIGMDIEELIRFNASRGMCGEGSIEPHVKKRMKHLDSGKNYQFERLRDNDQYLEMKGTPLPGGGYVTTYTDITEYKNIEAELRQNEQQIAFYTDNSPTLLAYLDRYLIFRFANIAFAKRFNLTKEKVIGATYTEIIPDEILHQTHDYIKLALKGEKQQFEILSQIDNKTYFIHTYIPHFDDNGNVLGAYVIAQDITNRRVAELALQEANITLEKRVLSRTEELNNTVLELENAKKIAEKADESKSRFMAAASHDLMQPFNAAKLFCEILANDSKNMTKNQKDLIQKTDQSLSIASNIIQSLVEFIKLDSGNIGVNKKSFLLQDILTALDVQFRDFAYSNELKFKILPSNHIIYSDPKLLYRILQNLVSNAIRYTKTGGVLVTNRVRGDQLLISVWDTGIGIEEEIMDDIFEEFKQFKNSDIIMEEAGLGLGLSISQRLVRLLDHTLTVRSNIGKGSVFHLLVGKSQETNLIEKTKTSRFSLGKKLARDKQILLVENNLQTLDAMNELLSSWGYNVFSTTGNISIPDLNMNGFTPDLLLVDYELDNDLSGIDFVRQYEKFTGVDAKALFVTANYSDATQSEISSAGYRIAYKPIDVLKLQASINDLLK